MALVLITIVIMLLIAGMMMMEGLFTASLTCVNVFLAGLVAFNFWEPLASLLEPNLQGAKAHGYEDALCLILIFWVVLGILRLITNYLSDTEIDFHPWVQRAGGAGFGLVAGYLTSGFLVCVFQTLPFHENFLGFEPHHNSTQVLRRYLPPDRVWLALMHRAGSVAFSGTADGTFDPDGSFTLRYARYRRYGDEREPLPYRGEFERAPAVPKDKPS